jgi:hypothetical protein
MLYNVDPLWSIIHQFRRGFLLKSVSSNEDREAETLTAHLESLQNVARVRGSVVGSGTMLQVGESRVFASR